MVQKVLLQVSTDVLPCVAGYMGDLMKQSEAMRWLGPSRYNLAGALTLFKNKVRNTPYSCFSSSASKIG